MAAVGSAKGSAARTIDAGGRALAPGFIDVHTHDDAQILWDRMLSISPWHGVTTAVMGNCGFGVAPTRRDGRSKILRTLEKVEGMSLDALEAGLGEDWGFETFPEYLDAIERRGTAIHVAAMIGHTPLRLYVMGDASTERAARPDEVAEMRRLVGEALAAGAIGFATSKSPTHVGFEGRPVPSRAADLDLALASDLEARFRVAVMNYDEDEVEELLRNPTTILGLSDAGAHASQLCDACFSTHLLSRWVRERRALSLEQAVRMLTTRVAEVFGITDRGRVAEGLAADLVLFDPATVGAGPLRRVHDLPGGADRLISEAEGIDLVVVGGTVVREDGCDRVDPEGPLPGRVLRSARAS